MSVSGRQIFSKFGSFLNVLAWIISLIPHEIRKHIFVAVRNVKGKKGILIRYLLIKHLALSCGENVVISENVYLYHPENLTLGNNVSIHPMCYIQPGEGKIRIGNDVSIAHGATVIAESHTYTDMQIPIKYQDMENGIIEIEDNVWIGNKVTILKDCHIGTGAVIGANTVVTKDVRENSVAVGNPAREIKRRG